MSLPVDEFELGLIPENEVPPLIGMLPSRAHLTEGNTLFDSHTIDLLNEDQRFMSKLYASLELIALDARNLIAMDLALKMRADYPFIFFIQ